VQLLNGEKTITCWLPKGASKPIIEKLMDKNVLRANSATARGSFVYAAEAKNGLQEQSEFEVLTVVVPEAGADETFEFIYFEGKVDQWGGGFMFMSQTQRSSVFSLPDVGKESNPAESGKN
jgi:hypothetical protein